MFSVGGNKLIITLHGGVEIALDKVWINASDFIALFDILLMGCCVVLRC